MKIRIVKENKIKPSNITFPTKNSDFFNIKYAETNFMKAKDGELNVFMHHQVYEEIWKHSKSELSLELGGALLGIYGQDNGNEFVLITGVLNQPLAYYQSETMLRFTKQFYDDLEDYISQINKVYPNVIRLGLYHTHPNYGVFLSTTDANTFRGIFKEKYQIAMVVDPIKNEDGVFYWQGNKISRRAAFRTYSSHNSNYCFQFYTTNNKHIEDSNTHLVLDIKRPTIQAIIEKGGSNNNVTEKKTAFQSFFSKTKKEKREEKEKLKFGFDRKNKKAEKDDKSGLLRIKSLSFLPKICPLYDVHYRNKEINLRRYTRSLSEKHQQEFPYMILIEQNVYDKIQTFWQKKQNIAGILQGNFCYDSPKKVYFLHITDVLLKANTWNEQATTFIHDFYKENDYKDVQNLLGWIYINTGLPDSFASFVELQQQLFDNSYNIGIVLSCKYTKNLNLENAQIVAYNFEKNQSFDYFRNLFICKDLSF